MVCFSSSPGLWVGLWSMSLPRGVVVGLLSVSLFRSCCGLICGLYLFLAGGVGWSVVCVSWGDCGLVCFSSSRGL